MRGGKIVLLVTGLLFVLTGLGLGAAGAVTGWAHLVHRDADGYVNTRSFALESDGYALTAEHISLTVTPEWTSWLDRLDLRLRVTPDDAGSPLFVGIGPRADVERYLDDVAHDEVATLGSTTARYTARSGTAVPGVPGAEGFWVASSEGTGLQTLEWPAESGEWAVVVMNADATPGLAVEADAGAQTGILGPIALGLLLLALALIGGGAAMIVAAVSDERRQPTSTPAGPTAAGWTPAVPTPAGYRRGAHPVTVVAHLDPDLSRWRWLVKWVLLIPHVIVLVFLWAAFIVLTFVAWVAILFTGRYPRGIFAFNVGVLRWTWRVSFYGYSALGTDRYPPFTLEAVDHPADLDVVYPERLSRGLALVKWLLAVPHLLIVAVLTGGAATWTTQISAEQSWQISLGGGLIGLLVLVAGISLLITARYPTGLFELLMGLNRWVYRVIAYVALMTDDYPPFRLDLGGDEPSPPQPPKAPAGARPDVPQPASA